MTSQSPTAVKYEFDADYQVGDAWKPLPVLSIAPSVDSDRVPYASAMMTLTALDEDTFAALDPRSLTPVRTGLVRWRIRQLDLAGNVVGYLPRAGDTTGDYAVMHVRSLTRTLETVRLSLSTAEKLLDDKLCLFRSDVAGSSYTNAQLIDWILELIISRRRPTLAEPAPSRVIAADPHAESILAAQPWDNVIRMGESYLDSVENELNSHGVRLVDAWGLGWYAASRGLPPTYTGAPTVVKLGSYTSDATHTLPADVDPIVFALEQTVSRDGEWADAVVMHGESGDGAYVNRWQQLAGLGTFDLSTYAPSDEAIATVDAHTRGRVISIDRNAPSGNLARSVATRAITRGHDLHVTARARFDVLPGMTLEVHLRDITLTSTIVAMEWAPETGQMFIRAQSASSTPPMSATADADAMITVAGQALQLGQDAAQNLAARAARAASELMQARWDRAQLSDIGGMF